jgi:hypothetical protein
MAMQSLSRNKSLLDSALDSYCFGVRGIVTFGL